MSQFVSTKFTPKEMLDDSLNTQKHLTDTYNTWTNECDSNQLRGEFMNLLKEEHDIQHDVYTDLKNRGWYQPEDAPQTKVDEAKQKFCCVFE